MVKVIIFAGANGIGSGNSFEIIDIAKFDDFKEAINHARKK